MRNSLFVSAVANPNPSTKVMGKKKHLLSSRSKHNGVFRLDVASLAEIRRLHSPLTPFILRCFDADADEENDEGDGGVDKEEKGVGKEEKGVDKGDKAEEHVGDEENGIDEAGEDCKEDEKICNKDESVKVSDKLKSLNGKAGLQLREFKRLVNAVKESSKRAEAGDLDDDGYLGGIPFWEENDEEEADENVASDDHVLIGS